MFLHSRIKRLFFLLSILLVVLLAACGKEGIHEGNQIPRDESNLSHVKEEKPSATTPSPTDLNQKLVEAGMMPAGIGFTNYLEAKGEAYQDLDSLMDQISEGEDALASLALLPLIASDLSILPLTALIALPANGTGVWESSRLIGFDGKGRAELKGDICSFHIELEVANEKKELIKISGEYDTKKDSFKAVFTKNDLETHWFEFTASGNGYVSQLYFRDDDGDSVIKNSFNDQQLFAGMTRTSNKPASIYQADVKLGKDFVENDDLMISIENGKGYAMIKGQKYDY